MRRARPASCSANALQPMKYSSRARSGCANKKNRLAMEFHVDISLTDVAGTIHEPL